MRIGVIIKSKGISCVSVNKERINGKWRHLILSLVLALIYFTNSYSSLDFTKTYHLLILV